MTAFSQRYTCLWYGEFFWIIAVLLYNLPGMPVQMLQHSAKNNLILIFGLELVVIGRACVSLFPLSVLLMLLPIAASSAVTARFSFFFVTLLCLLFGTFQAA